MSLPLSQIVNVQLNLSPVAPARRDFGALALFTSELGNVFTDPNKVYIECATQQAVENQFGTQSATANASRLFFSQTPRPKQLMIARWNRKNQTLPAVTPAVYGSRVTTPIEVLTYITDGYLSFLVDGKPVDVSGLNLSKAVTNYRDLIALITPLLGEKCNARVLFDEEAGRFILESKQAGATYSIEPAFDAKLSGTYLGSLLGLESAQVKQVVGRDVISIGQQSLAEAFATLQDKNTNWYAATVVDELYDNEIELAAAWIQASAKKVLGLTTMQAAHLEKTDSNVFKRLVDKHFDRTVVLYDKNDRYAINSWLARALAVNFAANNSTITMKFKTLPGVSADDLSLTEAQKCQALGINYYTYFDEAAMVAEGTVLGKRFFDEVHILDWFIDAVEKEIFATLYQSATKIPLTDAGTARLIAAVKKVCLEGVKNGAFAAGIWNGDNFGSLNSGDRLEDGFYVWADTVDNLSTSDRQARKAPPIQVAVKLAGAIHSVDVIVNFNR